VIKVWLKSEIKLGKSFNLQTIGGNSSREFLGLSPKYFSLALILATTPISCLHTLVSFEGRNVVKLAHYCKSLFRVLNKLEHLSMASTAKSNICRNINDVMI